MSSFVVYPLTHGLLEDLRSEAPSTRLHGWVDHVLSLDADATHFGFVQHGPAMLRCGSGDFALKSGMYFAVPGPVTIGQGRGLIITTHNYQRVFHLGGPIEKTGRLRYIDGCTDSLLIPPALHGDACLNLLHLPPGTHQTPHTHPSLRVGLIIRGEGWCETSDGRVALLSGQAFLIPAHALHCFHTEDSELLVLAYHPDSDFGPTHADHPMINRTLLPGTEGASS